MKKQAQHTYIEINRENDSQIYTRIDQGEDMYSKLIMIHQAEQNKHYLEIDASMYQGVLTNGFISSCLAEMQKGLRTYDIVSLKAIGLSEQNSEAGLFRRSLQTAIVDGSFSNLREVVLQSGLSEQELLKHNPPTMLPSRPFLKAELDFIQIDGGQVVPDNFLTNAFRVNTLICPDNNNTHAFLNSGNLDNVSQISLLPNTASIIQTQGLLSTDTQTE